MRLLGEGLDITPILFTPTELNTLDDFFIRLARFSQAVDLLLIALIEQLRSLLPHLLLQKVLLLLQRVSSKITC